MANAINEQKLNEFLGKVVGDVGAAMSAVLVVMGDKLGYYKAMANGDPVTPAMLCIPHSLAHHGPALGAQAGEARLREVIVDRGGFRTLRRATQTPFNLVHKARP